MCNKGSQFNWSLLPKDEVCSHLCSPLLSLPGPFHLVLVLMCASWLTKSTKIKLLPSLPSQKKRGGGGVGVGGEENHSTISNRKLCFL